MRSKIQNAVSFVSISMKPALLNYINRNNRPRWIDFLNPFQRSRKFITVDNRIKDYYPRFIHPLQETYLKFKCKNFSNF